jgi:hypothetical protein
MIFQLLLYHILTYIINSMIIKLLNEYIYYKLMDVNFIYNYNAMLIYYYYYYYCYYEYFMINLMLKCLMYLYNLLLLL